MTNNQTAPDEAIEKAARAICETAEGAHGIPWEAASRQTRRWCRGAARAALSTTTLAADFGTVVADGTYTVVVENSRSRIESASDALGVVDLRPGGDDARVVGAEAEAHRLRAFERAYIKAQNTLDAIGELADEHWDWKAGRSLADRLRALLADTAGTSQADAPVVPDSTDLRERVAVAVGEVLAPTGVPASLVRPLTDAVLAVVRPDGVSAERAWDEGYRAGGSRVRRQWSDEPGLPEADNPYRTDSPAGGAS